MNLSSNSASEITSLLNPAISHNIALLRQGLEMLGSLSDTEYTNTFPSVFDSATGDHVRHVVDHYMCFFEGLAQGHIDYEARNRDSVVANDKAMATRVVEVIINRLYQLNDVPGDKKINIVDETSHHTETTYVASTVQRELQFLTNHTVHHYALIAVIMRLAGREPAPEFGVSASTLRYAEALD